MKKKTDSSSNPAGFLSTRNLAGDRPCSNRWNLLEASLACNYIVVDNINVDVPSYISEIDGLIRKI